MNRSLVVSIHDVSPLTRQVTQTILERLNDFGVKRTSLLVIPDHHGKGHFLDDKGFCAWLLEKVQAGHEPVIHGYRHLRARKNAEGLRAQLTTRIYTADEGEFYDMEESVAHRTVARARSEFQSLGLEPTGFIAPAWLLSQPAERALCRIGLQYTVRLGSVLNLQTGEQWASQSLVYSTRAAWRRSASLLWNSCLNRCLQQNSLIRLSIHPPDFHYRPIWAQIERFIHEALLANRLMNTYGTLFPRLSFEPFEV